MLRRLRARLRWWRNQRTLKRLGYASWAMYRRMTDPDVFFPASKVKDYYHGYQLVHCFENHDHQIYWWDMAYDGMYVIERWCERHLQGKYRFDCLRCYQQTPIGLNGVEEPELWINELGSGDYFFFACKEPTDMFLFKLKWS